MLKLIPIKVECHSGFEADEYPKCFYWNNNRFEILEIIDPWYKCDSNTENQFQITIRFIQSVINKHYMDVMRIVTEMNGQYL